MCHCAYVGLALLTSITEPTRHRALLKQHSCCLLFSVTCVQEREAVLTEFQARLERRQAELEELRQNMQASLQRREQDLEARERASAADVKLQEERKLALDALDARVRRVRAGGGSTRSCLDLLRLL